jgi:hypothetical protein
MWDLLDNRVFLQILSGFKQARLNRAIVINSSDRQSAKLVANHGNRNVL